MAFYSAYQWNAYWHTNYQIKLAEQQEETDSLGRGGFVHPYQRYREEEYQREQIRKAQADLKRIEDELAEAESKKQRLAKAKKKAAKERAALLLKMEEEISRLRNERIWLMRLIDEEEAKLVLSIIARRRRFSLVAFN